jgi:hypothetical protein
MAIDRKLQNGLESARWRDAHEIQALRDTVGVYRRGAAALAAHISALRAENARLRGSLGEARSLGDSRLLEVEIDLDEYAQDLVGAILTAELADMAARELEDVMLVARELTVETVHRRAAGARAMLRVERSATSLRIEIQALESGADPGRLDIVERLSERWGSEQAASGSTTVWAQLAPTG